MIMFKDTCLDFVYPKIIKELLEKGELVAPRGMLTKEFVEPVAITLQDSSRSMISYNERKALISFYFGEFIWMLAGSNELEHVATYLKGWRNFTDDGKTLNGAYGNRIFNWKCSDGKIINQFDEVYKKLKADKNCRQAVISIYNPEKDLKPTKDVPCNDFIQFYVRKDKLCCTVYQRSCDIISGLTYDVHMFGMFQQLMAGRLGLEVGNYTHIANSLHLYERDFKMAEDIAELDGWADSVYDGITEPIDYRIMNNYEEQVKLIVETEEYFRKFAYLIESDMVAELLSKIENKNWKSALALLLIFNLRKCGRKEEAKKYFCHLRNDASILAINRFTN